MKRPTRPKHMKSKKASLVTVAIGAITYGLEQVQSGNVRMGVIAVGVGLAALVAYEVLQERQIAGLSEEDVSEAAQVIGEYLGDSENEKGTGE